MSDRKTNWFPRHVYPVRNGTYECAVKLGSSIPPMLWDLYWDGNGFRVPCPMMVLHWRGLAKPQPDQPAQEVDK